MYYTQPWKNYLTNSGYFFIFLSGANLNFLGAILLVWGNIKFLFLGQILFLVFFPVLSILCMGNHLGITNVRCKLKIFCGILKTKGYKCWKRVQVEVWWSRMIECAFFKERGQKLKESELILKNVIVEFKFA